MDIVFNRILYNSLSNFCHSVCSSLNFDERMNRLFVTINTELMVFEIQPEIKDRIASHERPVVAALYNQTYSQAGFTAS